MSDVVVKVGAEATQFQQVMAKVKAEATATGEAIGLELGNRKDARSEARMQHGLDIFIRSLANAKDPIQAVGGAIEGLSRAVLASGAIVAVAGIGTYIYDQFVQARDSADKLEASITRLGQVDANNESVHQLQKDVEDFQKVQDQYDNRGLLEKILFGAREDSLMKAAESLNEIKKNLIEIQEIQEDDIKSQARALEASDNPEDKRKGKELLKSLSDKKESTDLQDKLNDAKKTQDDLEKRLAGQEGQMQAAKHAGRGAKSAMEQASIGHDDLVNEIKKNGDLIASIKKAQADLDIAQTKENAAAANEENDKAQKHELEQVQEATTKQNELKNQLAMEGLSDDEKIALQKKKIQDAQDNAARFTGPKQESEILKEQNQLLEDKLELQKLITAADKKKKPLTPQEMDEMQEHQAEVRDRKAELTEQIGQERSNLNTAQAEAMTFHGQVSSLRRVGFGRAPAASGHEMQSLKAARDAVDRLDKLQREMKQLNDKIGGAA